MLLLCCGGDNTMFSKRLRQLRENNGYSMDMLTEIYNNRFNGKMNKSTLSRYENGLQEPIYTVVVNLSKLFNVSVDYLTCATSNDNTTNENKPEEPELEENIVVYHRDGKTVRKKMTKEKMEMLASMIDAIPEEDNPNL